MPDSLLSGIHLGFVSDGSPPLAAGAGSTTGGDDGDTGSCPTFVSGGHARQLLSGIYLGCVSNGSPLTDGGDDEREEWMSVTNLRIGAIRVLSVKIMNGKMFHLPSILQTRD